MYKIVLIIHVLLSVFLVGLILLQKGKGAETGASFGAGASQTIFGSQGSVSFLVKLTALVALSFGVTSITLTKMNLGSSNTGAIDISAAVASSGVSTDSKDQSVELPE